MCYQKPKQKILIVDDEIRIAAFIEKGLRQHGFDTAIASNGEQALQILLTNHFDLLLLDINLPIKDGITVLSELQAHNMLIPTIIVSASNEIDTRIKQLQKKAVPYISKPFNFTDLLNSINTTLLAKV